MLTKKAMVHDNFYRIAWIRIGFSIPFLIFFLLISHLPPVKPGFFIIISIAIPLEITAFFLYMKSINISPLSLSIPFLAFTPVFLIPVSYLVLGEIPTFNGCIGIFFVAAGAYSLNLNIAKKGLLGPIKAIIREKGSFFMLIVAYIYSITSSLGKLAIEHSVPVFFANRSLSRNSGTRLLLARLWRVWDLLFGISFLPKNSQPILIKYNFISLIR